MLDQDNQVIPMNMKKQLWDVQIPVALPHLMYYAPELWYQCLNLLGGQPIANRHKPLINKGLDSMEINHINVDTTLSMPKRISLQSVMAIVNDQENVEFLLDGGAICSIIALDMVKRLKKENAIIPTGKTLRFAGGEIDVPVGIIKLKLQFSEKVTIYHSFCVTANPSTPTLLGIDFILATRVMVNPHLNQLTFEHEELGTIHTVPTHPSGQEVEVPIDTTESLAVSVTLENNPRNPTLKDVMIDYEWTFEPGESQLLWVKLSEDPSTWSGDKVLQPSANMFTSNGLYIVPTVMRQSTYNKPYCMVVANMTVNKVSLKKNTILGQLMDKKHVPSGVKYLTQIDEMMDIITEMYINHHDDKQIISAPSVLEGPIFEPTKEELELLGVANVVHGVTQGSILHITYGEEETEESINGVNEETMKDQWDINPALADNQREQLLQVLKKHKSVFVTSLKEIKSLNVEPYSIKVKNDVKPVKVAPRMLPILANEWLKGYLKQLTELDMIETCAGPWAAAVVLVPNTKDQPQAPRRRYRKAKRIPKLIVTTGDKKPKAVWAVNMAELRSQKKEENVKLSTLEEVQYNKYGDMFDKNFTSVVPEQLAGKKDPYRLCLNYRPINLAVRDTGYPIPNINFLFTLLANVQYYSVFDCLKGFWQLEIDEASRDYTGFATTFGQYRWKRLPMGLKVSPQAWQSCVDSIFFEELYRFFLIYIDDGLVFSKSFEDHVQHLDRILTKAKKANLSLSISKCKFGYQEVKLLGHVVGKDGFKMDPAKIQRIVDWPRPRTVTEISQFVGMIQYYRRYLRDLSGLVAPMNKLKKKGVAFVWGHEQEAAFQQCKTLLTGGQVLIHPDFSRPFILFTDASNTGIGGVLSQREEGNDEFIRPVYYGSKALTESEKKTSIYEKEFLAIVYFIHFFKAYLLGNKFVVYTDQKSLQYLIKFNEEASAKVVRWQASLLAYDFDIVYRPGKLNANADALSRLQESYSIGPQLEDIMEDYYLPLNGIKHSSDTEQESMNKRFRPLGEENIFDNNDGMSKKEYNDIFQYLISWSFLEGVDPSRRKAIKYNARQYEIYEKKLYKKANGLFPRRQVVRTDEIMQVLRQHHDHLLAGHAGVTRTFDKIKSNYYWPGYYDSVRRYVSSCQLCQGFGPRNPPAPLTLDTNTNQFEPFSHIIMDYISLPLTKVGNNSVLVIVDKLTGWVECRPTPTQSSSFTCLSLFEWVCNYGKPVQVHVDNGTHFQAEEVKKMMMSSYGIQLRFGVPYHPQGQGKVERANGILKGIINKLAWVYADDWDVWISAAVYVMRTSARRDHGYSAFNLVYGRQPRTLLEEDRVFNENDDDDGAVWERVMKLVALNEEIIPKAKRNIMKYKVSMIQQYNKKSKIVKYYVNDLVLVHERRPNDQSVSLLIRWLGPFRVSEVVGINVYIVKDGEMRLPLTFHANQMKLYKSRPRLAVELSYYNKK